MGKISEKVTKQPKDSVVCHSASGDAHTAAGADYHEGTGGCGTFDDVCGDNVYAAVSVLFAAPVEIQGGGRAEWVEGMIWRSKTP